MPTVTRDSRQVGQAVIPDRVTAGEEHSVDTDVSQLPSDVIAASAETLSDEKYLDELNWLNQKVEVTLALPSDPQDLVMREVVYHQGYPYVFDRGVPKVIPRYVLGMLARKKKEIVRFSGQRHMDGSALNRVSRAPFTRFNHSYRSLETSPAEQARETEWYNKQCRHHF